MSLPLSQPRGSGGEARRSRSVRECVHHSVVAPTARRKHDGSASPVPEHVVGPTTGPTTATRSTWDNMVGLEGHSTSIQGRHTDHPSGHYAITPAAAQRKLCRLWATPLPSSRPKDTAPGGIENRNAIVGARNGAVASPASTTNFTPRAKTTEQPPGGGNGRGGSKGMSTPTEELIRRQRSRRRTHGVAMCDARKGQGKL